eukprot:TRINITY_DN21495_c0_g1_i1.p1 TRINITY_DN21495_c0_g1~~TRINITY_DN21495_c0_g1_i1.p1  ORF type:complete len:1748 (-),score=251.72 TRINITY_DN21495_c0_g1_i1:65-5308(-)
MGTTTSSNGEGGGSAYDVEPNFGSRDAPPSFADVSATPLPPSSVGTLSSVASAGGAPPAWGAGAGTSARLPAAVQQQQQHSRSGGSREAVIANGQGVELLRQGQFDEAIGQFKIALEYEPGSVQILNNIGLAYAKKLDFGGAHEWFEKAYCQNTKDIETLFSLAWVERKRQHFPQAKELFLKILAMQPDHVKALYLLGDILMTGHDYDSAARYLERLIRLDASSIDGHMALAQCLEHSRQYKRAAQMYSHVLELAPKKMEPVFCLGRVYYLMNKFDQCITQFDRVPDGDPRGFEARTYAAKACRDIDDRSRAISNAERAACIRKHPDVMLFLGEEFLKQEEQHMAEVWFGRAIEVDPDHMASLLELGQLMYKQGRWAEAERYLGRLCELDRNSVSALRTLAQARHRQRKFAACRLACEAALRLELMHPDTLWLLAECYRLGGVECDGEGERWLLALRYPPELSISVGDVCMAIAKAYLMRKQASESMQWLQKAEHYLPSDKRVAEAKSALSRMASPEEVLDILEQRAVMTSAPTPSSSSTYKPKERVAADHGNMNGAGAGAATAFTSTGGDSPASLERLLWRAERGGAGLAAERQWQELLTQSRAASRKRPQDSTALRCVARALLALKADLAEIRHYSQCAADAGGSGFTLGLELHVFLGAACERERDARSAEKHYREALSSKPGDERAMLGLARTLAQQGETAQARQLYEQVCSANPKCSEGALRLAELAVEIGDAGEAHRLATRAINLSPDDMAARLCMAQACVKNGRLDEAARTYETALGPTSTDVASMLTLASILEKLGRDQDCISWYKRVLEIRPGDLECNLSIGKLYAKRGAAGGSQALQYFGNALKNQSNSKVSRDISLRIADVHQAVGASRDAQQTLESLLRENPSSIEIIEKLLAVSGDLQDNAVQLNCFRRLERLTSLTASQLAAYGDALHREGHVQEARAQFERALREDSKCVPALLSLAASLRQDTTRENYLEEAMARYDQVLAINPQNVEALEGAAYCQRKRGNAEAAISLYQSCLKVRPTAEGPLYYLGDILYKLHRHNECQHNLLRLVSTNCGSDFKSGAYYLLAKSHVALDQYEEAEAHARAGLAMKSDHPHFLFILALIQNRCENYDSSIQNLEQAVKICSRASGNDELRVECHDWLAQAFERKHDNQKAMYHVDTALQLDPSHVSSLITKGLVHIQLKQLEHADTALRRALAVEKNHALALVRLGYCKLLMNELTEATQLFNRALQQRCGTVALPRSVKGTARIYLALTMLAQKDASGAMFQLAEARKHHKRFDDFCKAAKESMLRNECNDLVDQLVSMSALDVETRQAWQITHLLAKMVENDFQDNPGSSGAVSDVAGVRSTSTASTAQSEQRRWTAASASKADEYGPAASPDQRRWTASATSTAAPSVSEQRQWTAPSPSPNASTVASAASPEQRRWTAASTVTKNDPPVIIPKATETPAQQHGSLRLERHEQIDFSMLQQGECLGSGGFGAVYRGTLNGREVAIKKLYCEDAGQVSALQLEELEKEIAALRSLQHPRLVAFIGACLMPPNLCIITEFMPNGSLHHLLHKVKQPLILAQQAKLALHVCEGVVYLHVQRPPVVHRDLKSLNIVLDFELNAKLCDFGLTQEMEKTHISLKEGGNGGSPRYMAPECYDSKGKITEKVDVWALGCIMIECFGGPLPYDDCVNIQQIVAKVLIERQMPYVPHHLPTGVRGIVEDCFDFDAARRTSAQDALARLRQLRLPVAD